MPGGTTGGADEISGFGSCRRGFHVDGSRLSINLPDAGAEPASATVRDAVEIEVTAEGNSLRSRTTRSKPGKRLETVISSQYGLNFPARAIPALARSAPG
jgi:hypothetical protein